MACYSLMGKGSVCDDMDVWPLSATMALTCSLPLRNREVKVYMYLDGLNSMQPVKQQEKPFSCGRCVHATLPLCGVHPHTSVQKHNRKSGCGSHK